MDFSQPPPDISQVNLGMPPPSGSTQGRAYGNYTNHHGGGGGFHYHGGFGKPGYPFFRPYHHHNFNRGPGGVQMSQDDFDGKRLRKSVMRKTVDYNASIVRALEDRIWQRDHRDRDGLQPESIYVPELLPPPSYLDNPSNAVTTRFVKTATNKMRCPIFTLAWTPEGRRLVTGASSGEFTLWNGLTFNFETILQAHDVPVRTMVWSHNDNWMVTGDHAGYVKYWQSNMNNVKMFQAHKEPIRGISFSPSDSKFVSCSDDGTLRVWDFLRCHEERVLRGHGADVKCVHWHPQKALIVSGSKDNQQPIKLWDPKSGQALATLHAHKSTVMDLKWNDNGNWLVTASRDHLLKLFDLRNLREEVQVFRGHKKEASAISWHPVHEGLFSSGGSDGSILFWNVGTDKEVGSIDTAHDSIVWTLAWHPLGHILCSGSNDHTIKFWTRNRPGDQMRDKYNLNTLPASLVGLDECDIDEHQIIPGMGPEDKIEFTENLSADKGCIPGLDLDTKNIDDRRDRDKKIPYTKPIPRNFQAQWNDTGRPEELDDATSKEIKEVITQIVENTPGIVPLQKIAPSAIIVYGKMIPVHAGSDLEAAILSGPENLNKFISSGRIKELADVMANSEKSDKRGKSPSNDDNKSPKKTKRKRKSRFSDIIDHNAQMIYQNQIHNHLTIAEQNELETAQENIGSQSRDSPGGRKPQTSNIPSIFDLKLPQPNGFPSPPLPPISLHDTDFRSNFNNNNFNNGENDQPPPRLNPWASGITSMQNNIFNDISPAAVAAVAGNTKNFNNFNDGERPFNNNSVSNDFNGGGGEGSDINGSNNKNNARENQRSKNDNRSGRENSVGSGGNRNRRGNRNFGRNKRRL